MKVKIKTSLVVAAMLATSTVFLGCGSDSSNDQEQETQTPDATTYTIGGKAINGPLYNVVVTAKDKDGVDLGSYTISDESATYEIKDLATKPSYVVVKPTGINQSYNLGLDEKLGGGDDTELTSDFELRAAINAENMAEINITPLTHLEYITQNDLGFGYGLDGEDRRDRAVVSTAVEALMATGLKFEFAYEAVASSIEESSTFSRSLARGLPIGFLISQSAVDKASLEQSLQTGSDFTIVASVFDSMNSSLDAVYRVYNQGDAADASTVKAVMAIARTISAMIQEAVRTNTQVPDVSGLTSAASIASLAGRITEAEASGGSVALEELTQTIVREVGNGTIYTALDLDASNLEIQALAPETDDTQTDDTQTDETQTDDTQTGDSEAGDSETGDTEEDDTQADDSQSGSTTTGSTTTTPVTTQTKNINASTSPATSDAGSLASTYTFAAANYTYTISGFGDNDILRFPTGNNPTIRNSVATDGKLTIQWAYNEAVIEVVLTGITPEKGGSIFGMTSFNTAFGADSIQVQQ